MAIRYLVKWHAIALAKPLLENDSAWRRRLVTVYGMCIFVDLSLVESTSEPEQRLGGRRRNSMACFKDHNGRKTNESATESKHPTQLASMALSLGIPKNAGNTNPTREGQSPSITGISFGVFRSIISQYPEIAADFALTAVRPVQDLDSPFPRRAQVVRRRSSGRAGREVRGRAPSSRAAGTSRISPPSGLTPRRLM